MMKIEGIRIENFGPLKDITIGKTLNRQQESALGNITAIIGPSGTGKSTLADAFEYLVDCLKMNVEEACDAKNRGGFQQIRSQGSIEPIKFELCYREENSTYPITYELKIDEDSMGRPYIKEEHLWQKETKNGQPMTFLLLQKGHGYAYEECDVDDVDIGHNVERKRVAVELSDNRKLGIVTLGAMKQYDRIGKLLTALKGWYLCDFSPEAARTLQTEAPQPYLNRTGSNINSVAQYMYRENKTEFINVLKDVQTKLPNIERIEPVKFVNGQMMLKFWEKGFKDAIYSTKIADGTLKLFAYYLLLHESNPRQLVFIEEPEKGLYPQYLKPLTDEMIRNIQAESSRQIFVTTHSPFIINALSPEDVWVLEKGNDGFSKVKRASE